MKHWLSGRFTYLIGWLIIVLGMYQFFTESCKSGVETVLIGAGFLGLRRAIG